MPVLMMHVRKVWVRVFDLSVLVPMRMRLSRGVLLAVPMLMILVMNVWMRM